MSDSAKCSAAAAKVLGTRAGVLKCGYLTGPDSLQVVAAVRLKQFQATKTGIAVSKLVVLSEKPAHWDTQLKVGKWITNASGYIGIEFIDDSSHHIGYRVSFSDERSDGSQGFTMFYSFLGPEGDYEGAEIQVSWNPQAQRFQEYLANDEPVGFRSEMKNPPHRHCTDCKKTK